MKRLEFIQYKIIDVQNLQADILQEFYKIFIDINGLDNWQKEIYEIIKNNVNGRSRAQFINAWSDIQRKGIENYTVTDMDVALMILLSKFKPFNMPNKVISTMYNIQTDRHELAHRDCNETNTELFQLLTGSLYSLNRFLKAVQKSYENEERITEYIRYYYKAIEDLQNILTEEFERNLRYMREIEAIIGPNHNRNLKYNSAYESAMRIHFEQGDLDDFFIACARDGLKMAFSDAASSCIKKGYFEEAEKYLYLVEEDDPKNNNIRIMRANLYMNNFIKEKTREDGLEIIHEIEKKLEKEGTHRVVVTDKSMVHMFTYKIEKIKKAE